MPNAPASWTVVFRPSKFSPHFTPTGFYYEDWKEAAAHADELVAKYPSVYVMTATDTHVNVGSARTPKLVAIAPTAAQKNAAMDRANKVLVLLHSAQRDDSSRRLFRMAAHRLISGNVANFSDRQVAEVMVDADWTWTTVCRAMS